ncbi:DUF2852 domain-containing protein [Hansschlegelia beijingensis]|uniref:DUF2852 domain-containing protein n=1 Tax=Hansschlegelia beijingensis TaxID=1133344 RepID=A0A7W6GE44_9HYPH|nr:DUF2852 domain-containing protein [Hansschlegelia beijingensis]MBB3972481.1 hypothetical protein [Hansschlegelia beijingensis]
MTSNPYADEVAAIPGVPHRWTALTIALTVIGFVVFWPLGLAMIAYVLWGERIMAWARGGDGALTKFRRAAEDMSRNFRDEFAPKSAGVRRPTGNAAFDAWREAQMRRLDEERRKIDETTEAFEAHLRAKRGAFDEAAQREEFEGFMAGRHGGV